MNWDEDLAPVTEVDEEGVRLTVMTVQDGKLIFSWRMPHDQAKALFGNLLASIEEWERVNRRAS